MITASIVAYQHHLVEIKSVVDCILDSCVSIIFIIDNSLNDTLRILEKTSDRIRYIHSQNLGYGAGHNIAIRESIERGSRFHIVINPDISFSKGAIEKLEAFMTQHNEVGLIMPKILYPTGEIQYLCKLLPTPMDVLGRRFSPCKNYVLRRNEKYELRFRDYDEIMEVPSLSGCFMFMRVSVLKKVGGFDERFFMYAEDLDLCRRIGQLSKTMYYPGVSVFHEYAKGSYKNKKLLKYHIRSIIKYFNKWGWFFDSERRKINRRILTQYNK